MDKAVTLRIVEPGDAADVQKYASDPEISKTSNVPYPYPKDGGRLFVERAVAGRQAGHLYTFSIRYDNAFAGVVSLIDVNKAAGTAELGYWIARPFWGKGIATAAACEAVRYAFEALGLSTLSSACLTRNPASKRVLEKSGFIQTGEFTYSDLRFKGERMLSFKLSRVDFERKGSPDI
jgi:RimJ/RimL family protein N-acetyltransferase